MEYCFDEVLDRRGTNCIKWDYTEDIFGKKDILPLWVADMDFPVPPAVQKALKERAEHPIYGYSGFPISFFEAFANWMKKRHGWQVDRDWVIPTPGGVPAIALTINSFTKEGDKIVIQPPVYPPFFSVVKNNHRELVYNPLLETEEGYKMDFDNLEKKLDERTKMLVFCNPHNPVGRVWKEEELKELVRICSANDILIVSDEIWSDIVFAGNEHRPIAQVAGDYSSKIITCMATSKTFNLAGLKTSATVISHPELREKFCETMNRLGLGKINVMGTTSFTAAYNHGQEWLEDLLEYLEENVKFLLEFLKKRMPKVRAKYPEGTFVVWLDFNEYGFSDEELQEKTVQGARVGLNPGYSFGEQGKGFLRINIGCPRPILEEAMERLAREFE